jgi:small basic protein
MSRDLILPETLVVLALLRGIVIGRMIHVDVPYDISNCCSLLFSCALVHVHLRVQLLGDLIDEFLGLLAGLLSVALLLLAFAGFLFDEQALLVLYDLLKLLNLGELHVLGFLQFSFTLLVELKVVLGLFKHLAKI